MIMVDLRINETRQTGVVKWKLKNNSVIGYRHQRGYKPRLPGWTEFGAVKNRTYRGRVKLISLYSSHSKTA